MLGIIGAMIFRGVSGGLLPNMQAGDQRVRCRLRGEKERPKRTRRKKAR